jgi:hypothetical protein
MYSNAGTVTYEFRVYLPREETYAIRLDGPEINGVYGPLDYHEVLFHSLPLFPYDAQLDDLAWVKANLCDFVPCEAECDETVVRI